MPSLKIIPGCLNLLNIEDMLRLFTCVSGCHSNHPELIQYGKLRENFSRELILFPEVNGISCFSWDSKYYIKFYFLWTLWILAWPRKAQFNLNEKHTHITSSSPLSPALRQFCLIRSWFLSITLIIMDCPHHSTEISFLFQNQQPLRIFLYLFSLWEADRASNTEKWMEKNW